MNSPFDASAWLNSLSWSESILFWIAFVLAIFVILNILSLSWRIPEIIFAKKELFEARKKLIEKKGELVEA